MDRILTHIEREDRPLPSVLENLLEGESDRGSVQYNFLEAHPADIEGAGSSGITNATISTGNGIQANGQPHLNSTIDLQDIVQAVVNALDQRQSSNGWTARREATVNNPLVLTVDVSAVNWKQIQLVTRLIPLFAGKEEEDVAKWIDKITSVARMYKISDEVLALAAVSQLKDRALNWYNQQSVESVATWENFKYRIRRHFEITESYTATINRVGLRIWKSHSERFVDYAEDKLTLMQHLTLSEKEKIELLADGVKDRFQDRNKLPRGRPIQSKHVMLARNKVI